MSVLREILEYVVYLGNECDHNISTTRCDITTTIVLICYETRRRMEVATEFIGTEVCMSGRVERKRDYTSNKRIPAYRSLRFNAIQKSERSTLGTRISHIFRSYGNYFWYPVTPD